MGAGAGGGGEDPPAARPAQRASAVAAPRHRGRVCQVRQRSTAHHRSTSSVGNLIFVMFDD